MARVILHIDLDAFFCSVEELHHPELGGKPFVVGGRPETRGVVSSASYAARRFGIHSAMPTAQAVRLCPELVVLQGSYKEYLRVSRQIMAVLRESAPLVEQISIDEAFLDVSDDPIPGEQIAANLQGRILDEFHLSTSWGVATNKLVAKIASEIGKPQGLIVVPGGTEAQFLAPLPVQILWGVGPKTQEQLETMGIITIGELALRNPEDLKSHFGVRGLDLALKAKGIDERTIHEGRETKSVSNERTFTKDISDLYALRPVLLTLSEKVGSRLRDMGLTGSTIRLKLRWSDFTTITRQRKISVATSQDKEIFEEAYALLEANWDVERPVRLLGVGVSDLKNTFRQMNLFSPTKEEDIQLLEAIDDLRAKYGSNVLMRAIHLKRSDDGESINGISGKTD